MRRLSQLVAVSMAALLFACNNSETKEEAKSADTASATTPAAEVKPVFKPFKVVTIQTKVKNFGKWHEQFLADDSLRKAYGIGDYTVGRDMKDSNMIYVLAKMEDMDKAMKFSKLPGLKEVGKMAGVVGSPGYSYAEVVRSNDTPVASLDRLGVSHHVKDYAAWLKVFDSEGPAARSSNGAVDLTLARSLIDSNIVYLSFAVTDMEKARARSKSPELKKVMDSAGVDSAPTIRWFRLVK
ncbi:MAG TPA: hypothetical protein VFV08_02260 [Puia sp.]|nr:hypothetical protein [Puia sp.]